MGLVIKAAKTPRVTPLSTNEAKLADALARLMRSAGRKVDWDAVAAAVAALRPEDINVLIVNLQQAVEGSLYTQLVDALGDALAEGGQAQERQIVRATEATPDWGGPTTVTGKPDIRYKFNRTDETAQRWAEMRAGQLVTAIGRSTEESVRRIIFEAFRDQVSGDMTARRLRDVVGLHPRWALAVYRFSEREYERLRKAGYTQDQARELEAKAAERYRNKLIRARSRMIARTEISTASNMGRQVAWMQGVNGGWVDPLAQKRWSTSNRLAGGPCERCAPMRGETVRVDMPFSNGLLTPPAHPNCVCTAVLVPPSRGLTGLPSQNLAAVVAELGSTDASVPS